MLSFSPIVLLLLKVSLENPIRYETATTASNSIQSSGTPKPPNFQDQYKIHPSLNDHGPSTATTYKRKSPEVLHHNNLSNTFSQSSSSNSYYAKNSLVEEPLDLFQLWNLQPIIIDILYRVERLLDENLINDRQGRIIRKLSFDSNHILYKDWKNYSKMSDTQLASILSQTIKYLK